MVSWVSLYLIKNEFSHFILLTRQISFFSSKPSKPLKSPDIIDKVVPKSDLMNVRNSVRKMLFDALDKRKSEVKNEFVDLTSETLKNLCQEIEEHLFTCFNKVRRLKNRRKHIKICSLSTNKLIGVITSWQTSLIT